VTRLNKKVARRLEEERARFEKVIEELHQKFREGWWGDYTITFQAGDACMVRLEETRKTADMI